MSVNLGELRTIVKEVALEHRLSADVVGVVPSEGDGEYAEVVLSIVGCDAQPCRMSLGVARDASPAQLRAHVAGKLTDHMSTHAQGVRQDAQSGPATS